MTTRDFLLPGTESAPWIRITVDWLRPSYSGSGSEPWLYHLPEISIVPPGDQSCDRIKIENKLYVKRYFLNSIFLAQILREKDLNVWFFILSSTV